MHKFLLTSLLILILLGIGAYSYFYGSNWLDSDHSSEMVLGRLLAEENTFISTNWYYSTELRTVYQTIFTMPLFKFLGHMDNWALIRSINIVLNNFLLILSYFFLMGKTGIKYKWIVLSGIFLILPLTYEYWNIVTFGGYYVFFMAQLFFVLGLLNRLVQHEEINKKNILLFIFFILFSLLLGVQSVRSLLVIFFPLLTAGIYIKVKTGRQKCFPFFLGTLGFISAVMGFISNNFLHNYFSFFSAESISLDNYANYLQKFGFSIMNIAGFFGLESRLPVLSLQGILSIAAIIGTFFFLKGALKTADEESLKSRMNFIPVFFAAALAFNVFVFVISDYIILLKYFFPFMVLYVPLSAMFFTYAEKNYTRLKRIILTAGIIIFIFGQSFFTFQFLHKRDINSNRNGHIQYLLDNELYFGFATFWNANIATELSSGKIDIAGIENTGRGAGQNPFSVMHWLIPSAYTEPEYHTGETFLLLSQGEWDQLRGRGVFSGTTPNYSDEHFIVIRYPSAEIVFREILGY